MKPTTRKYLFFLLAVICLVSSGLSLRQFLHYRAGQQDYAEAAQLVALPQFAAPQEPSVPLIELEDEAVPLAELPEEPIEEVPVEEEVVWVDPYADALAAMDFTALREANDDVFGWIVIPGTNLSYPLVQGTDNEYYLNRTWRKGYNSVGAIFLDYRVSRDLSDFHSIIYGHRMNDRSMFGQLFKYRDIAYWEANPIIYIADDSGSHAYEIFSVYEAETMVTYMLGEDFTDDATRLAFLDYCASMSLYDTGIVPTAEDRILTLSTCTGNGHDTRWVVQAVRRG